MPEQIARFHAALPALRARLAPRGLAILGGENYLDRLTASSLNLQSPIYNCSPGQQFLFIDERGFVSPCSFTTQGYGIHLNEIRTLDDLHQLPTRFAKRKRRQILASCFDCPSTQVFGKFKQAPNVLETLGV